MGDESHRPVVEKPGDDPHGQPRDSAAHHGAEELAIIDVARGERRNGDVGIHADDLRIDVLVFEEALLLRHGHGQVRHVGVGDGDTNSVQRLDIGAEQQERGKRDRESDCHA